MKRSPWIFFVLSLGLVGLLAGSFPSSATSTGNTINGRAAASVATCKKTFTTGAGGTFFSWCYSPTGNIVKLSYPAGAEHIAVGTVQEGYLLCIGNAVEAWDYVSTDGGFGPATTGFSTVTRSAARLKLFQKYTTDNTRHSAKISMKVTNISGIALSDVRVARWVDFDVDSTTTNRWDKSARAVWASQTNGATLNATTFTTPASTAVVLSAAPNCAPSTTTVPFTGDAAGQVTYNLGTINKGAYKTVVFQYTQH